MTNIAAELSGPKTFDFILEPKLRQMLESDYKELESCVQVRAWKAVVVLSGSILETLLKSALRLHWHQHPEPFDIPRRGHPGETKKISKDDRSLLFCDLIAACAAKNVVSADAEPLSYIVKDYRNLVHTDERKEPPGEDVAHMTYRLVRMLIPQLREWQRRLIKNTAEEVLDLMYSNPEKASELASNLFITERQRFLQQITVHWAELDASESVPPSTFENLAKCYKAALASAPLGVRQECAARLIEVVKTGPYYYADRYVDVFFADALRSHFNFDTGTCFREYVLNRVKREHDRESLALLAADAQYITEVHLEGLLDILLPMAVMTETSDLFLNLYINLRQSARQVLDVRFKSLSKWSPDAEDIFDLGSDDAKKYQTAHDKCKAALTQKPN